nr:MAG TPA: hypothetical protein [Caudoviricetes sp.]
MLSFPVGKCNCFMIPCVISFLWGGAKAPLIALLAYPDAVNRDPVGEAAALCKVALVSVVHCINCAVSSFQAFPALNFGLHAVRELRPNFIPLFHFCFLPFSYLCLVFCFVPISYMYTCNLSIWQYAQTCEHEIVIFLHGHMQ